jgi:quercetin dioxygenase-like cupin family protein
LVINIFFREIDYYFNNLKGLFVTQKMFFESDNIEWTDLGGGLKRKIFGHDEKIMMVKIEFEKGAIGYEHSHPHSQTTYVESGVFEVTIDGKTATLKTGDSFFVPSDLKHGVVNLEAGILIDVFSPRRDDFLE